MTVWALVSPASRGIGLELARTLLRDTSLPIVATARSDLDQTKEQILEGIKDAREDRVNVLKVDFLDESTISEAAAKCLELFPPNQDNYLHLSFIVPGKLFPEKAPKQIDYDDALLTFRTNTLGPMMMLKHFATFLPRTTRRMEHPSGLQSSAVWAIMSARVGSISDNQLGGWYSYRASKAAVNQITKTFDNYLKIMSGDHAIAVSLHPGTVKTELSRDFWANVKEQKLFTPEFAAEKLLDVVKGCTVEHRGRIWDWEGKEIPP